MASLTDISYGEEAVRVYVEFNGALTNATVVHLNTGVSARGHAKQNPEDIYDQNFGWDLAVYRAKSRVYAKLAKIASKGAI